MISIQGLDRYQFLIQMAFRTNVPTFLVIFDFRKIAVIPDQFLSEITFENIYHPISFYRLWQLRENTNK